MRTQDFDNIPDAANSTSSTNGSSSSSSNGAGNSRGKPLAAIDTLDDVIADELAAEATSSRSSDAMGSRWRSGSPADGQDSSSKEGSSSRGGGRRGRMYSASDPIRRPRSRQGSTSEWALLPWQVCAAVDCIVTSL